MNDPANQKPEPHGLVKPTVLTVLDFLSDVRRTRHGRVSTSARSLAVLTQPVTVLETQTNEVTNRDSSQRSRTAQVVVSDVLRTILLHPNRG